MTEQYTIRRFEEDDLEAFLSLFETTWERRRSRAWFDWKYRENPYVDRAPIFVAESAAGEVVGARPFFALEMRCGDTVETCLQPGDTMVHPDHRRQGLFTRMTEAAIERYADAEPRLFFNFPNYRSRPGYEKLGWRLVSKRSTYYKIENLEYFGTTDSRAADLGVRLASGVASGGHGIVNRATDRLVGSDVEIASSADGVDALARFHDRHRPDEFHAIRDETFYEWRLSNPDWEYRTYLGYRRGDLEGAIVTGSRTNDDGFVVTSILEVLPLEAGEADRGVLLGLLKRAIGDHPRTDLFKLPPDPIPDRIAGYCGFVGDDTFPLSRVASRTNHVVRAAGDGWTVGAAPIDEPESWRMSFVEEDTG